MSQHFLLIQTGPKTAWLSFPTSPSEGTQPPFSPGHAAVVLHTVGLASTAMRNNYLPLGRPSVMALLAQLFRALVCQPRAEPRFAAPAPTAKPTQSRISPAARQTNFFAIGLLPFAAGNSFPLCNGAGTSAPPPLASTTHQPKTSPPTRTQDSGTAERPSEQHAVEAIQSESPPSPVKPEAETAAPSEAVQTLNASGVEYSAQHYVQHLQRAQLADQQKDAAANHLRLAHKEAYEAQRHLEEAQRATEQAQLERNKAQQLRGAAATDEAVAAAERAEQQAQQFQLLAAQHQEQGQARQAASQQQQDQAQAFQHAAAQTELQIQSMATPEPAIS